MRLPSRRALARLVTCVAALAAPAAARAQLGAINPFSFGISGGAAVPVGDFRNGANTGYSVDGVVNVRVPVLPVSFRGEVGFTRFGLKGGGLFDDPELGDVNVSGNANIFSGVANAVYTLPGIGLKPYLIAGVGLYNVRVSEDVSVAGQQLSNTDATTRLGLNGGFGVDVPLSGIGVFGDLRFTSIFTEGRNLNYIPIRVGIRF